MWSILAAGIVCFSQRGMALFLCFESAVNYFFVLLRFPLPQRCSCILTGKWKVVILTPDLRTFESKEIDASAPPSKIDIIVESPILYGNYVFIIENLSTTFLDGQVFIGSLINPDVTVTNTFNSKVATTFIQSAALQTFIPAQNPTGRSVQGIFVPPFNFID